MNAYYHLIINFCKAELVTPSKDWIRVEQRGSEYNVVFLPLYHSFSILLPDYLDMRNWQDQRLFGSQYTPYEDDPHFRGLAHMLELVSPQNAAEQA